MPCTRCETRSLECQIPTERRSKAKNQKKTNHELSIEGKDPSSSSAQGPGVPQSQGTGNPLARPEVQMGQFQLQISSDNPSLPSTDGTAGSQIHLQPQIGSGHDSLLTTSSSLLRSDITAAPDAISQPFPSFAGIDQNYYPRAPMAHAQDHLPFDQRRPSYALEGQQTEIPKQSNIASGMLESDDQSMQIGFSQSLLGPSAVAGINWLPNDLFLEPTPGSGSMSEPSQQSFQAVLDNSLSRTTWLPPVISTEPHDSSLSGSISQTTPSGTTSIGDVESPGYIPGGLHQPSQSGPSKRPNNYSADEHSGRSIKHRRKQSMWPSQTAGSLDIFLKFQNGDSKPSFAFPPAPEEPTNSALDTPVNCDIDSSTYGQMHDAFSQVCCVENFLYPAFETSNFPDSQTLAAYLRHYFCFFHPLYPIVHIPTFNPNRCHWIVTLALAAIGSHAANFCEKNGTATAFHEFLRRVLRAEVRKAQACLSNYVS